MKKLSVLLILSSFLFGCSNLPRDESDSGGIPPDIVSKVKKHSHDYSEEDSDDVIVMDNNTDMRSLFSSEKKYTPSPENLWERVRQGYGLTFPENPQIQRSIRRYLGYSSYFSKLSERAEPYLYHIVKEIEKRDMPLEFVFLPAIESFYNPKAYSHMGASGMWQFTAGTAELFGLERTSWYDGRRDIMDSTRAALDYLEQLHKYFNGDWLKAIGAYNCGPANIDRAVQRNRDAGKPTDFWSLNLPEETQNFVPNFIALSKIVGDTEKYAVEMGVIANSPYFKKVKLDKQIDFTTTAKLAKVSIDELQKLNPGYRRRATPPNPPYYLLVPASSIKALTESYAQLPSDAVLVSIKEMKEMKESPSPIQIANSKWYQKHRVKRGDTLGSIAKRYGTTVAELKRLNKISTKQLKAGYYLKVTESNKSDSKTDTSTTLAQVESTKSKNSKETKNTKAKSSKTTVALNAPAESTQYRVKKGDTLNSIAKRLGTTVSALKDSNKIGKKQLKIGLVLKVPASTNVPAKADKSDSKSTQKDSKFSKNDSKMKDSSADKTKKVVHTVRKGDNLWTIARAYDISVQKILQWNRLNGRGSLHLGQKIVIWLGET